MKQNNFDYAAYEKKKQNKSALVVAIILAVLVLSYLVISENSKEEKIFEKDLKIDAFVIAKNFIRQNLKAPSTAEFQSYPEATISNDGNQFTIYTYVDAQNSFGAMIRTHFRVVLKYKPETDKWELIDIEDLTR